MEDNDNNIPTETSVISLLGKVTQCLENVILIIQAERQQAKQIRRNDLILVVIIMGVVSVLVNSIMQ